MWPILLDMTKVDCKRMLRRLELEAYGNMVSALRAQGGLNSEKHKLLQDLSSTLNIPQERHRAEIRRAVNDERLATIAYCLTGDDTTDEWAIEGRRLVPLMPRMVPQTAYSVIADDEANKASLENDKLPLPASTERKRPLQTTTEPNKNIQYATSEFPNKHPNQFPVEDTTVKKRKTSVSMESSTLAQHLIMGPPKISRVQQLYRQRTKAMLNKQLKLRGPPTQHISNVQKSHRKIEEEMKNIHQSSQTTIQKALIETKTTISNNSAINNENIATTSKISNVQVIKPITTSTNSTKVQQTSVVVNTAEIPSKSIKICPARKVITTTPRAQNQSQKLIIVSNSQGNTTTSSILQRTLTIPFKTISMKNLDKLKVINTTSAQSISATTATTINQKPKLLTVHTKVKSNAPGKQINIPFIQGVQLQALQNKGAIKMVPLSTTTKMTSKSGIVSTSGSVYIMNSSAISAVTSSNSSPIMTPKPQTSTENETQRNVFIIKNEELKPGVSVVNSECNQNVVLLNVQPKCEQKSSVLTDILKASGVIPDESTEDIELPQEQCDIESQISQLTEIPTTENENIATENDRTRNVGIEVSSIDVKVDDIDIKVEDIEIQDNDDVQDMENAEIGSLENVEIDDVDNVELGEVDNVEMQMIEQTEEPVEHSELGMEEVHNDQDHEIVQFENADEVTEVSESAVDDSNYVILEEGPTETEMLVCKLEEVQHKPSTEVLEMMGNLDPETGMYSFQESSETDPIIEETEEDPTSSYVIELDSIHGSELDMPTLGLN